MRLGLGLGMGLGLGRCNTCSPLPLLLTVSTLSSLSLSRLISIRFDSIQSNPLITYTVNKQGSVWPTCNCIRIRIYGNVATATPNLSHQKRRLRFRVGAANAISNSYGDSREEPFDQELRSVLELATDSELFEIEAILFGRRFSFFHFHSFTHS